ncbi:MAG: sensor histidine kinase [Propionibacteriaceae bacterium]|jgi:signal transduction histidine kinase|nr:sensor histidine kinase [Propionibacteriaceae bacterium]
MLLGVLGVAGACWLEVIKTRSIARAANPPVTLPYADQVQALTRSRLRIVEAFELERTRIERDLHDGAQQYLVSASMKVGEVTLALASPARATDADRLRAAVPLLERAQDEVDLALRALRDTVAGVHSRLLAQRGLEAAVRELAARLSTGAGAIEVRVPHPLPEVPAGVASAAWFFAAEALTNAAKYAAGAQVSVVLAADRFLHVSVVDDGPGGARITEGGGLDGMRERLAAFGGQIAVSSPSGGPTTVSARIPLLLEAGRPSLGSAGRS